MQERKVYVPPEYVENYRIPIIFLGGPIQGTSDWQADAINTIHSLNPNLVIASPRRQQFDTEIDYNEQVIWELHHLKQAGLTGVDLFWLAKETKHIPERSYAQTSRVELGRILERHRFLGYKLVVGIEDGFSGARYLKKTLIEDFSDVPVFSSLEETCQKAVEVIQKSS